MKNITLEQAAERFNEVSLVKVTGHNFLIASVKLGLFSAYKPTLTGELGGFTYGGELTLKGYDLVSSNLIACMKELEIEGESEEYMHQHFKEVDNDSVYSMEELVLSIGQFDLDESVVNEYLDILNLAERKNNQVKLKVDVLKSMEFMNDEEMWTQKGRSFIYLLVTTGNEGLSIDC